MTPPLINGLKPRLAKQVQETLKRVRSGQNVDRYSLFKIKTDLINTLGVEKAFQRYKMIFAPGPEVKRHRQEMVPLLTKAKEEALEFHLFHAGGKEVEISPPPVIGEADIRTIRGKTRTVFAACFNKATAIARSSTVRLADGSFAFELQEGELDRVPVDLSFDPVVFHHDGTQIDCIADSRITTRLHIGEALSLLGPETMAYGHWIWEEFLKFLTARTLPELAHVPILIDAGMPFQHRQSLVAFLGQNHPIIEVPPFMRIEVDRLWIVSNWIYPPRLIKPEVFLGKLPLNLDALAFSVPEAAALYRQAGEELEEKIGCTERSGLVYVTRDPERHRSLANCEVIAELLAHRGFKEVRPEALSFIEQFALYRSSSTILAQAGSATFGMIFCAPATKVCQLSHGAIPFHAPWGQMLVEVGVQACILTGDIKQRDPLYFDRCSYVIDPTRLDRLMDEWQNPVTSA